MERYWQWLWDHHGRHYSWVVWLTTVVMMAATMGTASLLVLHYEGSARYVEAVLIAVVGAAATMFMGYLPGTGHWVPIQRWAIGDRADPDAVLTGSYALTRRLLKTGTVGFCVGYGATVGAVGAVAGADGGTVVGFVVLGMLAGLCSLLIAVHPFNSAVMQPVRTELGGVTGDELPRSRPSFVAWASLGVMATIWIYTVFGMLLAVAVPSTRQRPIVMLLVATTVLLVHGVPLALATGFFPWLAPFRELRAATERVVAGDYGQRVPVVQDDDLGTLAASFNRMQRGLAERERLHAAFGTYVDPALTTRLLEQGGDIFNGDRREVTVMFVDIRDFTPFAEANTAEDTVAHLNALFEIVVPAVLDAGGHVNKFLGDGAMAVFGAPVDQAHHADAAVTAAVEIDRLVEERFAGSLRIGIGINSGTVIAGTIGGGGKLEFTLIGDTVNVAARVEQLTKDTGDTMLLTQATVDAMAARPERLVDRGAHELKGKAAHVVVHALGSSPIEPRHV